MACQNYSRGDPFGDEGDSYMYIIHEGGGKVASIRGRKCFIEESTRRRSKTGGCRDNGHALIISLNVCLFQTLWGTPPKLKTA